MLKRQQQKDLQIKLDLLKAATSRADLTFEWSGGQVCIIEQNSLFGRKRLSPFLWFAEMRAWIDACLVGVDLEQKRPRRTTYEEEAQEAEIRG